MNKHGFILLTALLALNGCDQIAAKLGVEAPGAKEARQDAEGRAVGGACRHSGRAIEDCYSIYGWLPKASVFAGWRDMDAYMRENNIETIVPQLPPAEPPSTGRKKAKPAAAPAEGENAAKADDGAAKPGEGEAKAAPKADAAKH